MSPELAVTLLPLAVDSVVFTPTLLYCWDKSHKLTKIGRAKLPVVLEVHEYLYVSLSDVNCPGFLDGRTYPRWAFRCV